MFFGVNFLFGSIFVWVAMATVGPVWAVLAAFSGALHTVELWGHWFAVLLFTLEAVFVALMIRFSIASQINLSVLLYWVLLGAPLSLVLYTQVLEIPWETSLLVASKQVLNGLLNAMFASLIITSSLFFWPTSAVLPHFRNSNSYSVLLQAIFGLAFLCPILLSEIYELRQRFSRDVASVSASLGADIERVSRNVSAFLEVETLYWAAKLNPSTAEPNAAQIRTLLEQDKSAAPIYIFEQRSEGSWNKLLGGQDWSDPDFKSAIGLSTASDKNVPVFLGCYDNSFVTIIDLERPNKRLLFVWPNSEIRMFVSLQFSNNTEVQCLTRLSEGMSGDLDGEHPKIERDLSEKSTALLSWLGASVSARSKMNSTQDTTLSFTIPLRPLVTAVQSDYARTVRNLCVLAMLIIVGGQLLDLLFRRWVEKFGFISETFLSDRRTPNRLVNNNFREDREITKWLKRFTNAVETAEHGKFLAQRNFEILINKAASPIFATDTNGNISEWNPAIAQLTGFEAEEIIGAPLARQVYASKEELFSLDKKDTSGLFVDLKTKHEGTIHLVVSKFLVEPDLGVSEQTAFETQSKTYYVAQNLSELKESQARLIQVSRLAALGEMASSFAHELNQPLNTISLTAGNVLERAKAQPLNHDYLEKKLKRIEVQALRAGKIIRRIRGLFLEVEDSEVSVFNPVSRTTSAIDIVSEQLRLSDVRCTIDAQDESVSVKGPPVLFEQTMVNLLVNAQQAMSQNGTKNRAIRIAFEAREDTLTITVRDTGPGIPSEHLERVFDPFFSTKKAESGSGVGLFTTKRIIEAMHGRIQALDCSCGACIEIQLPLEARSGHAV